MSDSVQIITETAFLDEAISALRTAGRAVEAVEDPAGLFRVDGGPLVTARALVVVASALGLLSPNPDGE